MSYLALSSGLADFSKAVISLWFRVPQASIDAATEQALAGGSEGDLNTYFPALARTIPLVTFGSVETAITDKGFGSGAYPTSPSFIGVDCTRSRYGGEITLACHLAMSNNSTFEMTPMESDGYGDGSEPQFLSSLQRKDALYMAGIGSSPYTGGDLSKLEVTANRWHHALISFNLTSAAVMRYSTAPQTLPGAAPSILHLPGGPTFMWAFDDKDKTDWSLSPSGAEIYNQQPPGSVVIQPPPLPFKQITTNNLITIAGGAWAFIGTWEPTPIKSSGNPIGLPASAIFVDNIYPVEMAEFQFFTGVTLDTSIESNRRVFIDADGKPVTPDKKPTPPTEAMPNPPPTSPEELLGKPPDILLHGSGNWITGKNTGGEIRINEIGKPETVPGKPLTPTGSIVAYTPDPSLHGAQSPAPRPPAR